MKFSDIFYILPLIATVSLGACSSDPSFSVKGSVDNADGMTLLLERPDHAGVWIPLDSAHLKNNGKFEFRSIAPSDPQIYRLALATPDGDRYIYFPIDSIESLSITADAPTFASSYQIEGSDNAKNLAQFEKQLLAFAPHISNPDSANAFKRRVYTSFLQDARGSVVSYYILTKTVDDTPLFNVDEDGSYFAAVATSFRQFRPDDPRTELLERTANESRKRRLSKTGQKTVIQAEEINLIPINLPDPNGSNIALSQIAGHGVPTALVFSDFNDAATPALNIELKKLHDTGRLKIYNVGVSTDPVEWRNSARNLPWTTVFANTSDLRNVAASYMVESLPTIFLIDANGNLKSRCTSVEDLKKGI